ncbi:MAG: IS110 family transposase [Acidobacteriota bacterium]|nr:IS110 family transposase [Acidobacteriota bacterium]
MITLSVDPHPGSHTVVALDPNGTTLAGITVSNTAEGLSRVHQFAVPFARHRWAIEGAGNHFIAVFVNLLLERNEIVYSIPPSLNLSQSSLEWSESRTSCAGTAAGGCGSAPH